MLSVVEKSTLTPVPPTTSTMIKEKTMTTQTGSALKNVLGTMTINFPKSFSQIPTVCISPFYQGSGSAVGFVETISSVSLESFTVVSNNSAANYYVNWIAIENR
jgi:hypothetical protein